MTQNGGTRGGTFHGKMNRQNESLQTMPGLDYYGNAVVCPDGTERTKERIA